MPYVETLSFLSRLRAKASTNAGTKPEPGGEVPQRVIPFEP